MSFFWIDVCKKQQENLQIAYLRAIDFGLIDHHIPFRKYDYGLYYEDQYNKLKLKPSVLLNIVTAAKQKNINDVFNDLKGEDVLNANLN